MATMLPNEQSLINRAKEEPSAFGAIYDHYFSRVYNYVRYRVRDPQVTDDLTATIFERVLANLSRYQADVVCNSDLPTLMTEGSTGIIIGLPDGSGVRLRDAPSIGQGRVLGVYKLGEKFQVLEPLVCVDGITWYHIRIDFDQREGWMIEGMDGTYVVMPSFE